jgi:hypothetical protein
MMSVSNATRNEALCTHFAPASTRGAACSRMFKAPPAPFLLKQSSFTPIRALPLPPGKATKPQHDRSSHEPDSHDEIIPESIVNSPSSPKQTHEFHYSNNSNIAPPKPSPTLGEDSTRKRKKHKKEKKKILPDESIVEDSFDAEQDATQDIIEDTFAGIKLQSEFVRIPTPSPTIQSRKRKEIDLVDPPRLKKRKKSKAEMPVKAPALTEEADAQTMPDSLSRSRIVDDEFRKRRKKKKKAEKKLLKEERRRSRAQERQEREKQNGVVEEEHVPASDNIETTKPNDHEFPTQDHESPARDFIQDEPAPGPDNIEPTQPNENHEFPTQNSESPARDLIQNDPAEVPSGKRARKRKIRRVEIPSSQVAERVPMLKPPQSSVLKIPSSQVGEEVPILTKPPQSPVPDDTPTQPDHRSTPKRASRKSKARLSNQKIIDSSAEEEDIVESDHESEIERTVSLREKTTAKPPKQSKPKKPPRSVRGRDSPQVQDGKFSREEDEKIHVFVAAYKKVPSPPRAS